MANVASMTAPLPPLPVSPRANPPAPPASSTLIEVTPGGATQPKLPVDR